MLLGRAPMPPTAVAPPVATTKFATQAVLLAVKVLPRMLSSAYNPIDADGVVVADGVAVVEGASVGGSMKVNECTSQL